MVDGGWGYKGCKNAKVVIITFYIIMLQLTAFNYHSIFSQLTFIHSEQLVISCRFMAVLLISHQSRSVLNF